MLNQIAAIHGTGVAAATSSFESIATVTVGVGGTSSISFSSIPSTFKHLQIRTMSIASSGLTIQVGNGSVDTGSNYAWHQLYGTGSGSPAANAGTTQTFGYIAYADSTTAPTVAVTDLLDYQNSNKYKTLRSLAGHDRNGAGFVNLFSGLWQSSSSINTITISGTFSQYSQFALYGIKG